ncbi:MAG: gliding motility-associated C-terminal domain-containing protein [Bacteroidia bacterium]
MKKLLHFFLLFITYQCLGQGNVISITSTVPSQITVCGAQKTFTITLYNPSPFTVTNDTLKLTLPTGISYQAGSITGAGVSEQNISNLSKPVFLLPSIPSLAPALTISFTATASCDVIAFIAGGGVIENKVQVTYSANNQAGQDSHTTLTYTVKQPVLNITTVTNQTYSGSIGNTFTRCITVTNSGLGELSQFTFTDVHGTGIVINSVSAGNWNNSGTTETVTFSGSDFTSVGNNNNLLEQGESVTFCETVQINSCVGVASNFSAFWGCNSQTCQTGTLGANVIFPNLIPNIVITPANPTMNPCMGSGNASVQKLMIVNTGPGNATNIHLDIFQTNNGLGYNNSMGSWIDLSSITLQSNTITSITPDSTVSTSLLNCMPANSKGRMYLSIPSLNSGDTVYLSWKTYSCCYNACTSVGKSYFNGWAYQGSYSNICQNTYIISKAWGRVHSQLFGTLQNNVSPSVLDSGQTGMFNFKFNSYGFQQPYPGDTSGYWKVVFTLPACLNSIGNPFIESVNGVDTWNPTSVTTSGSTITAKFNEDTPPFDLNLAKIKLSTGVECNGCGGGTGSFSLTVVYVPSDTCSCEVNVACISTPVTILCNTPIIIIPEPSDTTCPHGMMFRYYSFARTSYGLPDNEPGGGNGIPDAGGTLNLSAIKTNRAMFGDTITSGFHGKIRTSNAQPSFQYCYANISIDNGNLLGFLDSRLLIYRNGTLIGNCSGLNPTITNNNSTRTFSYDLSTPGLISAGCVPPGFIYSQSDSVVFFHRYKVIVNTNGPIFNCFATNEFYVSNVANPAPNVRYGCDNFVGLCFVMGYKFEMRDDTYYTITSCQNAVLTQNYYLSIGPCCSNYEGGNLFPYEYRNWAHINTLNATLPIGYTFVSAQFTERRTAGIGGTDTCPAISLTPLNPDSTTLVFNAEQYYDSYGGTVPLSDDGFSGTLEVTVAPSCATTPVISQGIKYDWLFTPTNYLTGSGSSATTLTATSDYIIYNAPAVFLQSVLPSVNVADSFAVWDITLSNPSNVSHAENVWLSAPTISGVTVTELYDIDNSTTVPLTGNLFQLGTLNATNEWHFQIKATFNSCSQDSIVLYSGWNCAEGYPADVSSYPCTPGRITLIETPLLPALDMIITGPPGSVGLCDTTTYIAEGFNFQAGTLYNVLFTTILPAGVNIVPGSSQLLYPSDSVYAPIPNPVFAGGTTYQWDLSSINSHIANDGLKGFTDSTLNSFKIKFKVVTDCNFISGSGMRFRMNGNSACALPVSQEVVSEPLNIIGAAPVYTTSVSQSTTFISPCSANSTMFLSIVNTGNVAFGTADSVVVILPEGVNYENGSFAGIHNAPANPSPVEYMMNNQVTLTWKLPPGTQPGDSVVFNYNYLGSAEELSCGISYFQANTLNTANVMCSSTGSPCDISVITGSDTLAVFTYKGYLSIINASAFSTPNPPLGENATVSFIINNTGQDILPVNNVVISYYSDSNTNGTFDPADAFIAYDTLNATIPLNGSYNYTSDIFIPAGQACTIIASLDTLVNPCSCTDSHVIINIPNIRISADTTACSGLPFILGPDSINSYTYSWSPSSGLSNTNVASPVYSAPVISGTPDTAYFQVTVDRGGCTSTDTVRVITGPNPSVSVSGTDTVCYGDSTGIAIVVAAGGTSPYSYLWNTTPPQLNDTASALGPGTYSVIATDTNGCSASQQFTVNSPASPITVAITSQTNPTCSTVCSGTATALASGGIQNYTFSWSSSPAQTGSGATNLCAGTITVTATDAGGCNASDSTTITSPPALVVNTQVLNGNCISTNTASAYVTVSGGIPGYSYQWNTGQTTDTISGLSSGTYTVTVSDAVNCTQTAIATATPAVTVAANANPNNVCEGDSTVLNAIVSGGTPAFSFLWNNAQTSQTTVVFPLTATTYSVSVTDINGCIDSTTISITVRSSPVVHFISDSIGCSPACIAFTDSSYIASGTNQQWLWNFGDGNTSMLQNPTHCFVNTSTSAPQSNTVSLTVTSNDGCSSTLVKNNYITINPAPSADFDYSPKPPTVLSPFVSFQNLSLGASGWQWFFTNGLEDTTSVLQHPYYTYIDTGTFAVTLIATNNYSCSDTVRKDIIIGPDWTIYIPNAFTPNDDGINDTFFAKTYGIVEFEMLIFDRWGNLIFYTDDLNKQWDGKANQGDELAQRDVYVYVIKATDIFGNHHKYRGTVTLVR